VSKRSILACGFSILALAVVAGIFISFNEWDRGSPFEFSNWGVYNPLGRATYGTLAFALILFPITVPVLAVSSVLIYFGNKRQRLWPLSLLGFLIIGLCWVWYVVGVVNFD
jgi:hypothetical protein